MQALRRLLVPSLAAPTLVRFWSTRTLPATPVQWQAAIQQILDIYIQVDPRPLCAPLTWALVCIPTTSEHLDSFFAVCEALRLLCDMSDEYHASLLCTHEVAIVLTALIPRWSAFPIFSFESKTPLHLLIESMSRIINVEACMQEYQRREQMARASLKQLLLLKLRHQSALSRLPDELFGVVSSQLYVACDNHQTLVARSGLCQVLELYRPPINNPRMSLPLFYSVFYEIARSPAARLKVAEAFGPTLVNILASHSLVHRTNLGDSSFALMITLTDNEQSAIYLSSLDLANVCNRFITPSANMPYFERALIVLCNLSNFARSRASIGPALVDLIQRLVAVTGAIDATMILANLRGSAHPTPTSSSNQRQLTQWLAEALNKDWRHLSFGGYSFSILELLLPWLSLAPEADAVTRRELVPLLVRALDWGVRQREPLVCETALETLIVLGRFDAVPGPLGEWITARHQMLKWRRANELCRRASAVQ